MSVDYYTCVKSIINCLRFLFRATYCLLSDILLGSQKYVPNSFKSVLFLIYKCWIQCSSVHFFSRGCKRIEMLKICAQMVNVPNTTVIKLMKAMKAQNFPSNTFKILVFQWLQFYIRTFIPNFSNGFICPLRNLFIIIIIITSPSFPKSSSTSLHTQLHGPSFPPKNTNQGVQFEIYMKQHYSTRKQSDENSSSLCLWFICSLLVHIDCCMA